jgi:hypothetical protein
MSKPLTFLLLLACMAFCAAAQVPDGEFTQGDRTLMVSKVPMASSPFLQTIPHLPGEQDWLQVFAKTSRETQYEIQVTVRYLWEDREYIASRVMTVLPNMYNVTIFRIPHVTIGLLSVDTEDVVVGTPLQARKRKR